MIFPKIATETSIIICSAEITLREQVVFIDNFLFDLSFIEDKVFFRLMYWLNIVSFFCVVPAERRDVICFEPFFYFVVVHIFIFS